MRCIKKSWGAQQRSIKTTLLSPIFVCKLPHCQAEYILVSLRIIRLAWEGKQSYGINSSENMKSLSSVNSNPWRAGQSKYCKQVSQKDKLTAHVSLLQETTLFPSIILCTPGIVDNPPVYPKNSTDIDFIYLKSNANISYILFTTNWTFISTEKHSG